MATTIPQDVKLDLDSRTLAYNRWNDDGTVTLVANARIHPEDRETIDDLGLNVLDETGGSDDVSEDGPTITVGGGEKTD